MPPLVSLFTNSVFKPKIAYYGESKDLPTFLQELSLQVPLGYNPSDYMRKLWNT